MQEQKTQVLIVGGGLGGVAAALTACKLGCQVILTEETIWLGGQLTAQGVPPDENPWIDSHNTGCTASYRRLRDGIRETYRRSYPILPEIAADPHFNPGMGNVSPLCHEPRVALAVIEEMLRPYRANYQLQVLTEFKPISAETDGDYFRSVTLEHVNSGEQINIAADYVLDATELGDLLELGQVEHVIGAESQAQTGELHALPGDPDPLDQQAHSWVFTMDYFPGENHVIDKPETYDFWKDYTIDFWPDKLLSWTYTEPVTLEPVYRPLFTGPTNSALGDDRWHFRRIAYRKNFEDGFYRSDIVTVNWPQIDYWIGQLVGVRPEEKAKHWEGSRQLSLSLFYWMQTEAPRHDSGYGYPGLRLRGDVLGSRDGLALAPYIRESRRIKAAFTVLEQHVGVAARLDKKGAEIFEDTVGIGSYRIDLHPSYSRNYVDINNWPFQIPLGALIPVRMENLLPACKNLGVTHITNGCYRLHPVEWNIGEAAGALAAYCLQQGKRPRQVHEDKATLDDFQDLLVNKLGFELSWPEELRLTSREKKDPQGI